MPPLKNALTRNFSREASGLLTRVGHGRLLVIGDSSLDMPDDTKPMYYLGNKRGDLSVAAAFTDLASACPIDREIPVKFMLPDGGEIGGYRAPGANKAAIQDLGFTAVGLVREGTGGFYELSEGTSPSRPPLYLLTASEFAYDCIIATIGHSQK
jgi:hypothetical protein